MVPLVQAVEREVIAQLSSYLGHHIAFSSFRPRYVALAQVGITRAQLVFIVVSSIVLTFFRVYTRYKVCTIVRWLSAKHNSQLPSDRHGEVGETHMALAVLVVLAGDM